MLAETPELRRPPMDRLHHEWIACYPPEGRYEAQRWRARVYALVTQWQRADDHTVIRAMRQASDETRAA